MEFVAHFELEHLPGLAERAPWLAESAFEQAYSQMVELTLAHFPWKAPPADHLSSKYIAQRTYLTFVNQLMTSIENTLKI